ncbi:MAG: glycosyltransferase family 4 protein [Candidatus Margulisiibacteriota bacterium]
MKKILYYCDSSQYGGAEKYLADLISNLDPAGYRPICVIPKSKNSSRFREKLDNTKIYDLSRIQIWFGLTGIIKKEKPDIVHLNMHVPFSCFFAIFASKLTKVRNLFATVHSVVHPTSRSLFLKLAKHFLSNILLPKIDKFICVSNNSKEVLAANYGIDKGKISVVYNGIDVSDSQEFDGASLKRLLGINGDGRIVGVVSRIVKDKGIDDFLSASKKVLVQCPGTTFLIVGDGDLSDNMKELSASLGINKNVIFAGEVRDVFGYINIMDVCVMPSRHESMPYAILEYMAMKKPVVSTDVGGVPEIIKNGVSGLLVSANDPKAIADAVTDLFADPEKAAKMGGYAKELSKEMSVRNMASSVEELYCIMD